MCPETPRHFEVLTAEEQVFVQEADPVQGLTSNHRTKADNEPGLDRVALIARRAGSHELLHVVSRLACLNPVPDELHPCHIVRERSDHPNEGIIEVGFQTMEPTGGHLRIGVEEANEGTLARTDSDIASSR